MWGLKQMKHCELLLIRLPDLSQKQPCTIYFSVYTFFKKLQVHFVFKEKPKEKLGDMEVQNIITTNIISTPYTSIHFIIVQELIINAFSAVGIRYI